MKFDFTNSNIFPPMLFGKTDWEAFRTTPLSLTIDELSRYSKALVDPYTIEFAKKLCGQFITFSSTGLESLKSAIDRTSLVNLDNEATRMEDLLKLIQALATSEDGLSFLGVCNVVSNYYTVDSAISIFSQLAIESAVPAELAPTLKEWQNVIPLLEILQGPPSFDELVNEYSKLELLHSNSGLGDRRGLEHISAEGVIGSIMAMSQTVRGEHKDITSLAGKDAGWVVAVAEWLFSLKIELRLSMREDKLAGDRALYSNCTNEEKVQFTVRFSPAGIPVDKAPIVSTPLKVKDRKWKEL